LSIRIDLIFVPHPLKCLFECLFQRLFLKVASIWYNSFFLKNFLPSPVRFWYNKMHISRENASFILALQHTSEAVLLGKQTNVAIDVVTPWRFRFRFYLWRHNFPPKLEHTSSFMIAAEQFYRRIFFIECWLNTGISCTNSMMLLVLKLKIPNFGIVNFQLLVLFDNYKALTLLLNYSPRRTVSPCVCVCVLRQIVYYSVNCGQFKIALCLHL